MNLQDALPILTEIAKGAKWQFRRNEHENWRPASHLSWNPLVRASDGEIRLAPEPDPYEALKKAHAEGKVIQIDMRTHWWDFPPDDPPSWDRHAHLYRIKPEPEYVPLEASDVPPGSAFRRIDQAHRNIWCAPLTVLPTCVEFHDSTKIFQVEYAAGARESLFDEWQILRPGESWMPCKKMKSPQTES
jgi:hypothetical protein